MDINKVITDKADKEIDPCLTPQHVLGLCDKVLKGKKE